MRWQSLKSRITSVSIPGGLGGVGWVPPVDERKVAAAVLAHLEHKRVLLDDHRVEISSHVVASILKIRDHLSHVIETNVSQSKQLLEPIRAMRRACVACLRALPRDDIERTKMQLALPGGGEHWFAPGENGLAGLKELRSEFALHCFALAVRFEVDVEDEFADFIEAELGDQGVGRVPPTTY